MDPEDKERAVEDLVAFKVSSAFCLGGKEEC